MKTIPPLEYNTPRNIFKKGEWRLIKLDKKAEILLKHFRESKSQRDISKEVGVSRTTVAKYINEFESKYKVLEGLEKDGDANRSKILSLIEELSSEPKYDSSNRLKVKLTDEIIKEIERLLSENEKKKLIGRSKQLMKNIDIHEYLIDKGYDISYSTVCNFIKENHQKKEAYVRQEYGLGETLEFDWGEVKLTIAGKSTTFEIGLFTAAKAPYHEQVRLRSQRGQAPLAN